jgi:CBS domain-containing protein
MAMALKLCASSGGISLVAQRQNPRAGKTVGSSGRLSLLPQQVRTRDGGGGGGGSRPLVAIRAAGDSLEVEVKTAGQKGDILPSGEWPENFSLLNYEDLSKHYEAVVFKPEAQPNTHLADVMSKTIATAFPQQLLHEVEHHFKNISGLPVIDKELKCVGVLSKKDFKKASDVTKAAVHEVMTSPAITLSAEKTVSDAAVLMLKNKIHRIPIVNESNQVVGMVTRTDIFTALEGGDD